MKHQINRSSKLSNAKSPLGMSTRNNRPSSNLKSSKLGGACYGNSLAVGAQRINSARLSARSPNASVTPRSEP